MDQKAVPTRHKFLSAVVWVACGIPLRQLEWTDGPGQTA